MRVRKLVIGLSVASLAVLLGGCNDQKAYEKALQAEIDRRVDAGELAYPEEADASSIEEEESQLEEEEKLMGIDLEGNPLEVDGENVIDYKNEYNHHEIVYKIGEIYPAGEYVLVADEPEDIEKEPDAYYCVTMDVEGEIVVCSGSTANTMVLDTLDGEYLRIHDGKLYPIDQAPKIEPNEKGAYPKGRYKVGVEIPAGEYVIRGDEALVTIMADLNEDSDSDLGYRGNRQCVEIILKEGEYIEISEGEMYPIDKTADLKPSDGVYKDGMYKVGFHMPAGTYTVKADVDTAYVEIYDTNTSESKMTDQIVAEPESTFTVKDGQYVSIIAGKATQK